MASLVRSVRLGFARNAVIMHANKKAGRADYFKIYFYLPNSTDRNVVTFENHIHHNKPKNGYKDFTFFIAFISIEL